MLNFRIKIFILYKKARKQRKISMNLFEYMNETNKEKESPLASRLRPRTLDEVVGQKHILNEKSLLYRAIKADKLSSLIFYGPPGLVKLLWQKL